ncbi:MAG: hypothetical protein PUF72_06265 [Clostridiales bacterium]|nr:hypothetical protein [Clostridiales bacterium]
MKRLLLHIGIILIPVLIIADARASIGYAVEAINMCVYMIVPTLFPFFVCSGLLIYSGFCERMAKLFRFCMMPLFRVSPVGSSAFVLGIISGYPLGAATAGELFQNGYLTKTEAQRLLAFCNNSGPLFILGSVGIAMYSKIHYGVILYVIHILSAITVGIIMSFYRRNDYTAPKTVMTSPERSPGEIFSIALQNAISTMLTVCGAVIFFSIISRLVLALLPLNNGLMSLAAGICEFVTGTSMIASLDINIAKKLIMTAFVIGFAGFSVHLQVMAVISRYRLSIAPYLIGKLLHGIIAAVYTMLYLHFFPITETVFAPAGVSRQALLSKSFSISSAYEITAVLAVALLGLILAFAAKKKNASQSL